MQREKKPLNKHVNGTLFQDTYGILQLAANATLIRTPSALKFIRWTGSVLMVIRQLWAKNSIIFFEFVWADPMDFMQETICRKCFENNEEEMHSIIQH